MKSKITVTIESDKPIDVVNKEEGGVTINPMTPDVELEEPVQGLCCSMPKMASAEPDLSHIDDHERRGMVAKISRLWVNGTHITYTLLPEPSLTTYALKRQHEAVREAFYKWKSLGIGLTFEEVKSRKKAMVRIGFVPGKGSWSYVGTMCLRIPKAKNTVNFGWNLYSSQQGHDTALHELGHVLGLTHEHQSPNNGIVWNKQKVYDTFSRPPNSWSKGKIDRNILNKLTSPSRSTKWDKNSIMEYPFPAGVIVSPKEYQYVPLTPTDGLSDKDIKMITDVYPAIQTLPTLDIDNASFISKDKASTFGFYINNDITGNVKIQFIGRLDCILILYAVDSDGTQRIVAKATRLGKDELSFPTVIKSRLESGVKYKLMGRSTAHQFSTHDAVVLISR